MTHTQVTIQNESIFRIGQGCMGVGGRFSPDMSSDEKQIRALQMGIDLGMSFIDTAEVYGGGHSEELVGRAIRGRRERVFIASKVSPEHLSPFDLTTACEDSLNRFKIDCLDLYQIHWPNPAVPIAQTLEVLIQLREQGKIRHIGISNFSLTETQKVQGILDPVPLFSIQMEYNLFEREAEDEIIPWCNKNGVAVIAYSPLDQGRIVGSATIRDKLLKIARRIGHAPSQIALNYICGHGNVIAIPKATSPEHIKNNATACDFDLPPEIFNEIGRECRPKITFLPWGNIRPEVDETGEHKVYTTIEEALANSANHTPSPLELSMEIRKNARIKPIKVVPIVDKRDGYHYDLVEGRLRFWAWVLAFNGSRDVPVLIRN